MGVDWQAPEKMGRRQNYTRRPLLHYNSLAASINLTMPDIHDEAIKC